jgi:hypothetical protein
VTAGALGGDAVEQGELSCARVGDGKDTLFNAIRAHEQPMGDGHTFQQDSFGGGLGLPLGFEDIPELPVNRGTVLDYGG